MTLYKWLMADGKTMFGRSGWDLPNGAPGDWLEANGDLVVCQNGIHLCRPSDLIHWIGERLYEAEADGEVVESNKKIVVRKARLLRRMETINDRTLRLYAADCAESVLHLFEEQHPNDTRPRAAIEAARDYARREIGAAARDAAGAAAGAAWAALNGRLLLYAEHGESAAEIPVTRLGGDR